MGGKTSTAIRSKYNAKTYERLVLNLRIDSPQSKKAIEAAAEQAGESATAYVVEAVRRRMEQEQMLSASDTPGVVKNLEGDIDPVEWDSCSISPDLIKIQQQKASVFHGNVIGRGFSARGGVLYLTPVITSEQLSNQTVTSNALDNYMTTHFV